ncbi:MAG: acyl-CoA desaturase, partial [Deltaproteobacteria bacterium]|nr:acyl-CoA desaturase [Deltaproteobacteria bacterium]
ALKYGRDSQLATDVRARVSAYFDERGLARDGGWRMIAKSSIILAWATATYLTMLLVADTWWQLGLLAVSMGLSAAGIGFCIQHDGGHGAYSSNRSVTRLAAWALDFIGGSSYMWHHKHNILHHTYPNVEGADDDIGQAPWLRLSSVDEYLPVHRHQHWYSWFLYGFVPPKWMLIDDFRRIFTQRAGTRRVPPPRGRALAVLFLGKIVAYTWVFAIPIAIHGLSFGLLAIYMLVFWIWGLTLATTFQLAHCNADAEFSEWPAIDEPMGHPWAEQQLATTVNFSQNNPVVTWYVGGLNYQIEHHLFPKICHLHYPAISGIVRQVCEEHGVPYRVHPSLLGAIRSHILHLKRMGRVRGFEQVDEQLAAE